MFDVTFTEPVTGFAPADVTLAGTAAATSAMITGGPAVYTVTVSGMTGDGTVIASVPPGVAANGAGNTNLASTSTDNVVAYDASAPSVTVDEAAAQADPTDAGRIVFDVVFSEPVSGFATGDVALSGTAGATVGTVRGTGSTYTVTVSGRPDPARSLRVSRPAWRSTSSATPTWRRRRPTVSSPTCQCAVGGRRQWSARQVTMSSPARPAVT